MRKDFDCQRRFDCSPVLDVSLNLDCRDAIIPILRALQYVYSKSELRDAILDAVARDVNPGTNRRLGRQGMSYWQIVVLVAVRLGCNFDYDKLQDLAEQHRALRQIMGIGDWDRHTTFDWRRIQDNVTKVRPETIAQISQMIAEAGHEVAPEAVERVRADSFVVETNIHYPTDSSLISDGLRKILSLAAKLAVLLGVAGWRQHHHLQKKARNLCRQIDRIAARKGEGYQDRLKAPYRELFTLAEEILQRAETLQNTVRPFLSIDLQIESMAAELAVFMERTQIVCDVARRRVLEEDRVPREEKLFSIFETHTQMYKRGKTTEPVQFGRQLLIYEDAAGFILHGCLLPRDQDDRDVAVEETRNVQSRFGDRIRHISFDRGFHSPTNQQELSKIVPGVCLPKPGKHQAAEQQATASVAFHRARQRHPGVESAIGALQSGNGLARCRDRSDEGFSRYLQLGILGRNLHVLGKLLIARERGDCQASHTRRKAV